MQKISEHLSKEENKNKSQGQGAKGEEKSSDQSQDREAKGGEKQNAKSESENELPVKQEISVEEYPLKDLLFTENIYNKSNRGDPEQQLEYAKGLISHAFVCFIGMCKYAYLQDEEYGREIERQNDLSLQNINWNEDFIKSLKNSKSWQSGTDELSDVVSYPVSKDISAFATIKAKRLNLSGISGQKNLEGLNELLCDSKRYDSPYIDPKNANEKINKLRENFAEAIVCFDNWRYDVAIPYLMKLIMLRDWPGTVKEIKGNEDENNRKREIVTKNKEVNKKINDALKEQWQQNKYQDLNNKKRKALWQIVEEANEKHKKLEERGILFKNDNSEGTISGAGYSENFVKLFIRYLERSFPELDDCVRIYYYPAPNSGFMAVKEYCIKYWKKVRYWKNESTSNGMIYFVVNHLVPCRDRKKGESGGHGNLTIICNGKDKVFESAGLDQAYRALGIKSYGKKSGNINFAGRATIQRDTQNCVTMALGYAESLMKEISKNKEEWEKSGKSVSECFFKEVNKFSTVELPEDITGPDKEQPLKILLPSKYIKYMQTSTGIQKLITYARGMEENNKDYAILQEVADELELVTEKYSLLNQPAKIFLCDVCDSKSSEFKHDLERLKEHFTKFIEVAGLSDNLTVGELTNIIREMKLTGEKLGQIENKDIEKYTSTKVLDGIKDSEKGWVEKELTENNIYKLFNDDPSKMTYSDFSKLEEFLRILMMLAKINIRAQTKRRTETLKIDTLVNTVDSNDGNVQDEINAVGEF